MLTVEIFIASHRNYGNLYCTPARIDEIQSLAAILLAMAKIARVRFLLDCRSNYVPVILESQLPKLC